MTSWTETEFQRAAESTKLSARTLAACKDVLVGGMAGVDAAASHQMFPAQISRAIGLLRGRQEELGEVLSNKAQADEQMRKYIAGQVAISVVGEGTTVEVARRGYTYEGPALAVAHGYLIQKVGRSGVLHDIEKLSHKPAMNALVEIVYSKDNEPASVIDKSQAVAQEIGIGR